MKKIGGGWQHVVYDMGDGRVYKKFRTPLSRFFYIYFNSSTTLSELKDEVHRMDKEVTRSFEIIRSGRIPLDWLGNPELFTNFDYTQDKLTPLHVVFNEVNTERGKQIVDMFIMFIKKLFELGFIDLSFKAASNFSLNKNGSVVLTDIGEITEDKTVIEEQRKARDWYSKYVDRDIKNPEVRKYFRDRMDESFGL